MYIFRLFSIDKNALFSEMTVAKNPYKSVKLNKCMEDLIKMIEKDIYPNLYTLFKVAFSLANFFSV